MGIFTINASLKTSDQDLVDDIIYTIQSYDFNIIKEDGVTYEFGSSYEDFDRWDDLSEELKEFTELKVHDVSNQSEQLYEIYGISLGEKYEVLDLEL